MKILHQQRIKEQNIKRIITLISGEKEVSRATIARITKLSKTTVSTLVELLIDAGYVLDCGVKETSKQGRKPNKLLINEAEVAVATVSWQPGYVEGAFVSLGSYKINSQLIRIATENDDYVSATVEVYNRMISNKEKLKKILGLAVIVPGSISSSKKILTTVLPIHKDDDIISQLRELITNIPIAILNDTACISYAENYFSGAENKSYIFINMSKGIGAVLFSRGQLLRDADGMTTQFGHFSIDRSGNLCDCGNRGCLENKIGEKAIIALGEQYGILPEEQINYMSAGRRADLGDPKSFEMINSMAKDLAYAVSNMVTIYNVPYIVIGGRGVNLGENFLRLLTEYVRKEGFQRFTKEIIVEYSDYGYSAKAEYSGAAKYYIDRHYSFLVNDGSEVYIG